MAVPDPPTGLTATAIDHQQIDLSWTAPATPPDYYEVAGMEGTTMTDVQADANIIATEVTSTSYSHTGLTPSTDYVYKVRSVNDSSFVA